MVRVAVIAVALAAFGAGGLPAAVHPAVHVKDLAPVTISGTGFVAGEHVVVTLTINRPYVHRLAAGEKGSFVTRYPRITLTECQSYTVKAVGDLGSRAVKKVVPECPPPAPPD
jgi:hypothetical protein